MYKSGALLDQIVDFKDHLFADLLMQVLREQKLSLACNGRRVKDEV